MPGVSPRRLRRAVLPLLLSTVPWAGAQAGPLAVGAGPGAVPSSLVQPAAGPQGPGWRPSVIRPSQLSVALVGRDRRFRLEITCAPSAGRSVSHSLFLTVPRGWTASEDSVKLVVDGVAGSLELDGSEGGVTLSNALFGNVVGITRETAARLLEARQIVVEARTAKPGFPTALVFEGSGLPLVRQAQETQCAAMGPWAEPAAAAGSTAAGAAAPAAPAAQQPSVAARASAGRYLFDVLRKEPYKSAWRALPGVPAWLRRMDGPSGPSTAETVEGTAYEAFDMCRAHACDEFNAQILFTADGRTAFAAVRERGVVTLLGNPSPAVRARLQALLGGLASPPAPTPAAPVPAASPPAAAVAVPPPAPPPPIPEPAVEPGSPVVVGVAAVRSGAEVEGFATLKRAADAGDARAAADAGMLLLRGVGTPKDERAGLVLLQRAADAGDPFGRLGLAMAWVEGLGATLDYARAAPLLRQALGTPAEPEALAILVELPDAGLPGRPTPDQAEAERRRLCALVIAARHRTASATCTGILTGRVGGPAHLAAIEAALRGPPWTQGRAVASLYVPDFFADNDATLRNRIAHTWEFTRYLSAADVKAHLAGRGLTLDRPAP